MVWWFWVLFVIWVVLALDFETGVHRWTVVVSIPLLYRLVLAIGVRWFLASLVVSLILLAYCNLDELKKIKFWFLEDLHIPLVLFCLLAWWSQPVLSQFQAAFQAVLSELERCCVR